MTHLSLLKTYPSDFEAELVKMKLEREGIEAVIHAGDLSNIFPSLDYTSGFSVLVEPADFARAEEIVDSPLDDLTDEMDTGAAASEDEV